MTTHFLTLMDVNNQEIKDILNLAINLKAKPNKFSNKLFGKTLALLFQKTSTRTRMSFESGMIQLGGHAIFLDWRTTNLTLGGLQDEIKCMARYVDAIMARVYEHSDLNLMAEVSKVPIINGLSDSFHPCQTLADLMTIIELFSFEELKNIQVSFVGDGSNNVASSLIIGCAKLGIRINIGTPKSFNVRKDVIDFLIKNNLKEFLRIYEDPFKAVKNADIIYTDTWVSMGQEEEKERRVKIFEIYQVNEELVKFTSKHPKIMHCLPAHRDYEISSNILDSENSVVYDQAENRLHVQKALLLKLLSPEYGGIQKRLF